MPINYQQAVSIAQNYLKQQPNQMEDYGGLALKDTATIEKPYGWIFFYNTRRFLETGEFLARLGGNAPILIEKATGTVFVMGTAHPLQYYLADYERFHPQRLVSE